MITPHGDPERIQALIERWRQNGKDYRKLAEDCKRRRHFQSESDYILMAGAEEHKADELTALLQSEWSQRRAAIEESCKLPPLLAASEPALLQSRPQEQEQQKTPEWGVVNCLMLARRRLNALRQRAPLNALLQQELESWEHAQRICEESGARTSGVLRAAVPPEITGG